MSYKILRQFTMYCDNLMNRIYGYHGHDQKRCIRTVPKTGNMHESFLFTMHEGLPREGPGSTACTKKMFSFLPGLPEYPAILDIGCGSGMQTIDIARLCPKARITAVDVYPPFLTSVKKRVIAAGFSDRARTVQASMDDLPFPPTSIDLIWAEGFIFILGVEQGITLWKKILKTWWFSWVYRSDMVHKIPLRKCSILLAGKLYGHEYR